MLMAWRRGRCVALLTHLRGSREGRVQGLELRHPGLQPAIRGAHRIVPPSMVPENAGLAYHPAGSLHLSASARSCGCELGVTRRISHRDAAMSNTPRTTRHPTNHHSADPSPPSGSTLKTIFKDSFLLQHLVSADSVRWLDGHVDWEWHFDESLASPDDRRLSPLPGQRGRLRRGQERPHSGLVRQAGSSWLRRVARC